MPSLLACFLCPPARAALPPKPPQGDPAFALDTDLVVVPIPKTRAGKEMIWVLDVMNGAALGDAADKFTADFLKAVPQAEMEKAFGEVKQDVFGGRRILCVGIEQSDEEREDTISITISARGSENFLSVFLILDDTQWKIAGLRFAPAGGAGGGGGGGKAAPADWADFRRDLDSLPGEKSFGAYEIVARDKADPSKGYELFGLAGHDEDKSLAIGSTFKLYVLGALAEEVRAGRATWDEALAIKDDWKSLPSGKMQLEKEGTAFPLSRYADLMISISDNTAADHLIHRLGREQVEAFTSVHNPNVTKNTPFVTTREMFVLKLHDDGALVAEYELSTDARQREMLDTGEFAGLAPDLADANGWDRPRMIDTIEWFGSAKEICGLLAALHAMEQQPGQAQVGKSLRLNPGLALDRKTWKSIAYKGGSEPGVLNMSWLLERNDGKWYVMSVGWNDKEEMLDEKMVYELAGHGFDLLAKDGREDGMQKDKQQEEGVPQEPPAREKPAKKVKDTE